MTTCYKLTDANLKTHGGCLWTVGEWRHAAGDGELCGPGWLHCYDDPLVGLMLNPAQAAIKNPRLWRAERDGATLDCYGTKRGTQSLRLTEELVVPVITTEQRVKFGILPAKRVIPENTPWHRWACRWLDGTDRSDVPVWEGRPPGDRASSAARSALWAAQTLGTHPDVAEHHAATAAMEAAFSYVVWAIDGLNQLTEVIALPLGLPAIAREACGLPPDWMPEVKP
jgi:hypothetical protein